MSKRDKKPIESAEKTEYEDELEKTGVRLSENANQKSFQDFLVFIPCGKNSNCW